MGKKIILFGVLVLVFLVLLSFNFANQDFDGKFTMNVPIGTHYSDTAYCLPNGKLGCVGEYWPDNSDCVIDDGDIVVFYYNNSLLQDGEANAYEHALGTLTNSYLYHLEQRDGDLIILTNSIEMQNLPPYLAGKVSGGGNEVVFVGGKNLNDVKRYANSIEFLN